MTPPAGTPIPATHAWKTMTDCFFADTWASGCSGGRRPGREWERPNARSSQSPDGGHLDSQFPSTSDEAELSLSALRVHPAHGDSWVRIRNPKELHCRNQ